MIAEFNNLYISGRPGCRQIQGTPRKRRLAQPVQPRAWPSPGRSMRCWSHASRSPEQKLTLGLLHLPPHPPPLNPLSPGEGNWTFCQFINVGVYDKLWMDMRESLRRKLNFRCRWVGLIVLRVLWHIGKFRGHRT